MTISPPDSVALSGALTTTTTTTRLSHSDLQSDQAVYEQVEKHIG
ncbi:hypothetical protein ACFWFX_25650 [Streptomyces roseolus]